MSKDFITRAYQPLARALWQLLSRRAGKLVSDPAKAGAVVVIALAKANRITAALARAGRDLSLLAAMTSDWRRGKYRRIPTRTIAAVLGALLYWVMPLDAIMDVIPGLGFVDDAFVLGLVIHQFRSDIALYQRWRESDPLADQ